MVSKKRSPTGDGTQDSIQLTTNEQAFRLLFESHPIPMLIYDLKSLEFLQVNQAAVETYGYSRDEFKKLNIKDIISDAGVKRLLKETKKKRPALQHSEWQNRLKDGRSIDVEVTSHILDFEGRKSVIVVVQDITERKQAETALRVSEEKFRKAFMTSPDAININRLSDGMYVTINQGFTQIMGYKESECLGKTSLELNIWNDPNDRAALVAGLAKAGEVSNLEARFQAKNGDIKLGNMSASILELDGVKYIISITRDITARKQEQENLSASEAELRALFASMRDAVMVIDRGGIYRKIAPTNSDLLIKLPQDLLGRSLRDVFPAEQADIFIATICQVLETQQSTRIEYQLLIGERMRWFSASISPMDSENTLWVARDVTQRKLADAALQESEERFRALFDRMMDGIYRSTHEGKFVDVNPAMVKMFGYSNKEELLAVDIKNELYFSPEERGSHILDTGQEETEEYRMKRKDGSEIWVEDHGYYIHDEQGNPKYHEGMLRDITARKKAEDQLNRINASLILAHRELEESLSHEQSLARTDGLTGLYNYRYFFELASREFEAAVRYQRSLSIIIFDMDHLKQVNDSFGHLSGDRMLLTVAQTAKALVRSIDSLARYGGDEFVILLPQTNAQTAFAIAERIRASVTSIRMTTEKGPLFVTLSIGIAEMYVDPPDESVEQVVQRADQALYAAKQAGRNRTVILNQKQKIDSEKK